MKRSIAIFIGHVGGAFQKLHAETLDVVHVNLNLTTSSIWTADMSAAS